MKRYFMGMVLFVGVVSLAGCTNEPAKLPEKETKIHLNPTGGEKKGETEAKTGTAEKKTPNQQAVPEPPRAQKSMNNGKTYQVYPEMVIDTEKTYIATMKTSAGTMTIKLNAKEVPKTVNSFVFLAKEKFYDGVIFHRTIPGFMIQGGDPTGTGAGGPGYRFDDEPFTGEYKKGTLAMANAGPDTNGSQFFIMHADYPLPKNYTIFGEVTEGLDVVDKIATAPTQPGGEGSKPVTPVTIETVEIVEK